MIIFYVIIETALILLLLRWIIRTDWGQSEIKSLLQNAKKYKVNKRHPFLEEIELFPNTPKEQYENTIAYKGYELSLAWNDLWIEILKSLLKKGN